jgi:hypothetical protein
LVALVVDLAGGRIARSAELRGGVLIHLFVSWEAVENPVLSVERKKALRFMVSDWSPHTKRSIPGLDGITASLLLGVAEPFATEGRNGRVLVTPGWMAGTVADAARPIHSLGAMARHEVE